MGGTLRNPTEQKVYEALMRGRVVFGARRDGTPIVAKQNPPGYVLGWFVGAPSLPHTHMHPADARSAAALFMQMTQVGKGSLRTVTTAEQDRARSQVSEGTMVGRFTLSQIRNMPTIESGQFDNLKYDDGEHRVWHSRMHTYDGQPYDDQVTVEVNRGGGIWKKIDTYDPRTVGRGVHEDQATPWVSTTYGVVPKIGDFDLRLRDAKDEEGARLIGDPPRVWWMTLVDDDEIQAVRRLSSKLGHDMVIGPDVYYPQKTAVELRSVKALHSLIEGLVDQWNHGSEAAGNLASNIMYVLRYEWI